jgi:hypothetical protein
MGRERPTGSARILIFNAVERVSEAPVELSFCGSALLQHWVRDNCFGGQGIIHMAKLGDISLDIEPLA